ncbi:hypothetical protein KP78_28600 [Jeotgalibacillus soli]|uniref:Uncharacterized protein n=1 Tax=Jeotgalibacillus soli TaxID=889306 RepID=A0A0C2VLH5_9BACL|nr:hypothetical protein KP78_28600 [Jeotgalibacillus soli]
MKMIFSSFQWMIFIIAGSIATPIANAALFQLDAIETAGFVQRTMFVLGMAGIVQVLFGHRLPINESPAGLWWGVFIIYATFIGVTYETAADTLKVLKSGLLISGIIFLLLALTGVLNKITILFTPTITFTYLMLLIFQLSGPFFNGITGFDHDIGVVQIPVIFGSLITIIFTFWLGNHQVKWVQHYSIVMAFAIGWLVFAGLGLASGPLLKQAGTSHFQTGLHLVPLFLRLE